MSSLLNPPLIRADKLDYERATYESKIRQEGEGTINVLHQISPGNLVHELLQDKKAAYACELISSKSLYRELFVSAPADGAEQTIKFDPGLIMRKIAMVRPFVLSKVKQQFTGQKIHGLHKSRLGHEFIFEKGWILADAGYWKLVSTESELFKFEQDPGIKKKGTYKLSHEIGLDFVFKIRMEKTFFAQMSKIEDKRPDLMSLFMVGVFANALSYLVSWERENEGAVKKQEILVDLLAEIDHALQYDRPVWEIITEDPRRVSEIASLYKPVQKIKFGNDD